MSSDDVSFKVVRFTPKKDGVHKKVVGHFKFFPDAMKYYRKKKDSNKHWHEIESEFSA